MKNLNLGWWSSVVLLSVAFSFDISSATANSLNSLCKEFETYTGARLVFYRENLPPGKYYDMMKPLKDTRKTKAAAICLREAKKYPPRYFEKVGLETIGVFAACVSKTGDRFRKYDKQLGGYRYLGIYNKSNAIAAAYYGDGQLPLTFHHEIFHHVDSTVNGITENFQLSADDARYLAAIDQLKPYAAPELSAADLKGLKQRSRHEVLRDAVSIYSQRNSREDQAETARYLMSTMPDCLVQIVEQPELNGSQRILHVIREYESSVSDGPGINWFVDVALERTAQHQIDPLLVKLAGFARQGASGYDGVAKDPNGARETLKQLSRYSPEDIIGIPANKIESAIDYAAQITHSLLLQRIRPDAKQQMFTVWGHEDVAGVNWTLRKDLKTFASDAQRLGKISQLSDRGPDKVIKVQMKNMRLVSRYYAFIDFNWKVTPGTGHAFYATRSSVIQSLSPANSELKNALSKTSLKELAHRIPIDGSPTLLPARDG